jgi:glycosyltransferase involved in cell wall biosynthesis
MGLRGGWRSTYDIGSSMSWVGGGERPSGGSPGDDRFAVVVITRNRRKEVLRSLEKMTALPEAPRILVADNGSTDGTCEAVAVRFPQVRLFHSPHNLGALARNAIVRQLRTPYVAFCDDDIWWEPGALSIAADTLDAHDGLASVTGRILVEPAGVEDPIVPELRGSPVPAPGWLPGPALLGILAGASMLRVSAFRDAGGFSPRLWLGGEEELLTIDLAARGWWMCYRDDVVVHHAASAIRDSRERRRLGIRNTLWTTWLRRPVPSALRRSRAIIASLPPDVTSARALTEAVAGLPWVVREHRAVPRQVENGLRLLEEPQRRSVARRYVG